MSCTHACSVVLVNLPVNLKQFEGATATSIEIIESANPHRKSSGSYNVIATVEASDDPVHMRLRGKFLKPVLDRAQASGAAGGQNAMKLELAKQHKDGYYKQCVDMGDGGAPLRPGDSANNRR